MSITTTNNLLTGSWSADVKTMEDAIERFKPSRNECRVAFFEIAHDGHLHVNVTHRHETTTAAGWDGPARVPQGFVHNRVFENVPAGEIVTDIRKMVFANKKR
jgi:hypothetical protein